MSQEELQLKPVIDSYEKLISAICDKLRESWMTTEDEQHVIAEEIIDILLSRTQWKVVGELLEKEKLQWKLINTTS